MIAYILVGIYTSFSYRHFQGVQSVTTLIGIATLWPLHILLWIREFLEDIRL